MGTAGGSTKGGNEAQNQRSPDGALQLVPQQMGTDSKTPNAGPRDAEPGQTPVQGRAVVRQAAAGRPQGDPGQGAEACAAWL